MKNEELEKKVNEFLEGYAKENNINKNEIHYTDELEADMLKKTNPKSFEHQLKSLEILKEVCNQFSTLKK